MIPPQALIVPLLLGAPPLLFVFLLFQHRIVQGIAGTGLK